MNAIVKESLQNIYTYFPDLSSDKKKKLELLYPLYEEWNNQINVVSRKDIEHLYLHHVLHSLSIAKFIEFLPQSSVLDIGTGGGFPGIPLAIMFPETQFLLTDSIAKKIKVVNAVIDSLELKNAFGEHIRSEKVQGQFDFAVTRAVAPMVKLKQWSRGKFKKISEHKLPNGIIMLKGGDLQQEIKESGLNVTLKPIADYFNNPYFETKYVAYAPMV
jgi:16S rRNA (guanine527-N7)-methyltransferase